LEKRLYTDQFGFRSILFAECSSEFNHIGKKQKTTKIILDGHDACLYESGQASTHGNEIEMDNGSDGPVPAPLPVMPITDEGAAPSAPQSRSRSKAKAARNTPAATIRRLKALVQERLTELETTLGRLGADVSASDNEREIRSINMLVRTLEKVLELEAKERAGRVRRRHQRRQLDDARREEIARRLEAMHGKRDASGGTQAA
jgi:hypothetical protein